MSNKGVCRTALAKPGLLISLFSVMACRAALGKASGSAKKPHEPYFLILIDNFKALLEDMKFACKGHWVHPWIQRLTKI